MLKKLAHARDPYGEECTSRARQSYYSNSLRSNPIFSRSTLIPGNRERDARLVRIREKRRSFERSEEHSAIVMR
jgi:hypothetical protein